MDIEWNSASLWSVLNISNPICLDENLNITYRTCNETTWIPKDTPDCLDTMNFCGANHFVDPRKFPLTCIAITEKMEYRRLACPIGFHNIIDTDKYINLPKWVPMERKTKYYPFEYYDTGFFNDEFSNEIKNTNITIFNYNLDNQNCVMSVNRSVFCTSCKNKYSSVCAYNSQSEIIAYRCPSNCVPSVPWENKCLCLNDLKRLFPRNRFCKKIASLSYDFELRSVLNLLSKELCWIDTNNVVTKHIGMGKLFPAINKYGLTFHEYDLKCAVCEENPLPFERVTFELKFNEKRKKLVLTVYSATSLYSAEGRLIDCFTDASTLLVKQLDFEINTSKLRSTMSYKIPLEKYPGQYWCQGFQLPKLEIVTSNTVVAYKKFKGNEYALRLNIALEMECGSPFNLDDFNKDVIHFLAIENILNYTEVVVRPMQIYKMQFIDSFCQVDILVHLTSTKKRDVIGEYFRFKESLTKTYSQIIYFRSSYFCLPENSKLHYQIISWKLTKIGKKGLPKQLCIQDNGLPVTRTCSGTFLEGKYLNTWNTKYLIRKTFRWNLGQCRWNMFQASQSI